MNVGDKVTWTKVSGRGGTVSLSLKRGEIVEIDGDRAVVKTPRGKPVQVRLTDLRPEGQKSTLSEFAELVFESARNRAGE